MKCTIALEFEFRAETGGIWCTFACNSPCYFLWHYRGDSCNERSDLNRSKLRNSTRSNKFGCRQPIKRLLEELFVSMIPVIRLTKRRRVRCDEWFRGDLVVMNDSVAEVERPYPLLCANESWRCYLCENGSFRNLTNHGDTIWIEISSEALKCCK